MLWDGKPGAGRAPARVVRFWGLGCVVAGTLLLAGCNGEQSQTASLAAPRGASVAFESIDGPPPAVFQKLVHNLNTEAQARRLAVVSREGQSAAYRVRGYLAARKEQRMTAISWVWDVYDGELKRGLRIAGEEKVRGDGWAAADDAALQRIASASMTKLAAFLTSPDVAPGQMAIAAPPPSSPEAHGIFRISRAAADPVAGANETAVMAHLVGPVPLPPHRPKRAVSAGRAPASALTLAAAD